MPTDPVELAEALRPVQMQNGNVYELESAPLEMARAILAMKEPPAREGSTGWGGRIDATNEGPQLAPGALGTKTIFTPGDTNRNQVSAATAATYPYRAVGRFQGTGCTGFFVGPRTVVTAAHCLYDPPSATWLANTHFVPGKSEASEPWGRWPIVSVAFSSAWSAGWVPATYNWDYDFAVVELNIAPGWTGSPGWFGVATTSSGTMGMLGYPQDKGSGAFLQTQMWVKSGNIVGTTGQQYKHKLDAIGGDSGACMYQYPNLPCVGIHSYSWSLYNGARKWDSVVYNFVGANSIAW
jgi:glutamyl endopeptidase